MELKTGQDELKANVALLTEEHKKRMKVVNDCFKTLFIGLAMNGLVFGPIRGAHQPQQHQQHEQEHPRVAVEHQDGEERAAEDPHTTQEGPNNASGDVDRVTPPIVSSHPIGEYFISWSLLPDICPY